MIPRIRIVVVAFALALLAAPAQASATPWSTVFAAATACDPDPGPFALTATDDIVVPAGWQIGSPAGTLSIALAGSGVQGYQWRVDCGTIQSAASGSATITPGNGTFTFTHRAQETGTGDWTPWVDATVRIDATIPDNTTAPPTGWRRGPLTVNVTGTDATSAVSYEWRDGVSGPWTSGAVATVDGTGTHILQTAVMDAAGNRDQRSHTVKIDNTIPVDATTAPVGWQHAAVDVTVAGSDADSGVARVDWEVDGVPGTGALGSVVHIGTHGTHTLKTKIVDNVGNETGWTTRVVQVDINGPLDTTTVPAGWVTTPSTIVNVTGTDTAGSGVVRIQWELDDTTTGDVAGAGPVPVTISGDGVHKLETRLTDSLGDDSGWRTQYVRIDTVTPTDTTSAATGWLPQASLDVTVGGTDAHSGIEHVEWKIDSGSALTFVGTSRLVTVAGNGEHTLETRVADVAGHYSAWVSRTIRLDATAPSNLTPTVTTTGWRTTSYSVLLNGSDDDSGVDSVRWRVDGGAEHIGTRQVETAAVTGNGTHTLETRVRDVAGNFSSWRSEPVNIDAVKPADTTVYPVAAVGNGRKVALTGTDGHSGLSGNVHWRLDGGAIKTSTSATIVGAGPHTLETQVEDNAGNWSDWRSGTVTVNPALPDEDADAPLDTTSIPSIWQTAGTSVTVSADDAGGSGVDYVEWRLDGNATQRGPSGTTFLVSTDGQHDIETRATDKAGNVSPWRLQTLKVDTTLPQDTAALPADWSNSRSFTLDATDATSGILRIDYKINNGSTLTADPGDTITLPADGTFTVSHRVHDIAGHATGFKTDTVKVDTVLPVNTTAPAPTAWQTSALSLALAGTDALSGVEHAEWRVGGGTAHTGTPALVETEGTQTLETRILDKAGNASTWRSETVKVDVTKPVNTTAEPSSPWIKTSYTTTVAGTDAVSGVASRQYTLDGGSVITGTSVSITAEGTHTLLTRVLDTAGNYSDWRTDTIGIDKTVPALTVSCGPIAWRSTPASCSVTADGGLSGLPTLTAARNGGAADAVANSAYAVEAEGVSTISFRAVDGAGNEKLASAEVRVDRTAPAAAVSCAASTGTSYLCKGTGSDALSGLSALSYSLDGSAAAPLAADGAFTVQKGTVVVTATDAAGNVGASAPVKLADRTPPPPAPPVKTPVTPRTTSEAVLLRGGGSASARLLGQLALSATPTKTTVDLRPLALGKGQFQFVFKVTTGSKSKTITKNQTVKSGYSARISVSVPVAGASSKVALTVRRRSGGRWVAFATGAATLR